MLFPPFILRFSSSSVVFLFGQASCRLLLRPHDPPPPDEDQDRTHLHVPFSDVFIWSLPVPFFFLMINTIWLSCMQISEQWHREVKVSFQVNSGRILSQWHTDFATLAHSHRHQTAETVKVHITAKGYPIIPTFAVLEQSKSLLYVRPIILFIVRQRKSLLELSQNFGRTLMIPPHQWNKIPDRKFAGTQ